MLVSWAYTIRPPIKISAFEITCGTLIIAWQFCVARSITVSIDSFSSFSVFIKLIAVVFTAYLLRKSLVKADSAEIIFKTGAIAAIIHGILCIAEYIEAPPIPPTWIDPAMKSLVRTRCAGIFTDPNIFGAFLVALFFLSVGNLYKQDKGKGLLLSSLPVVICGVAILMTLSRGAWVSLVAGAMFLLVFSKKMVVNKSATKYLCANILILLLVFGVGPFKYRFMSITNTKDMTINQRSLINQGISRSLAKIPITGFGLHSFNTVYPSFRIVGGDYPMNAHNEFLHSLIETGPLSSILLLGLVIYLAGIVLRKRKQLSIEAMIFIAIFVALLVHNLTGFSTRILPTATMLALAYGGILVFISTIKGKKVIFNTGSLLKSILVFWGITLLIFGPVEFLNQSKLQTAATLLSRGKPAEAIDKINEIAQRRNSPIAQSLTSNAYKMMGNYQKSLKAIQLAAALNPMEAGFWMELARLKAIKNKYAAEIFFRKGIELDPASELYRLEFAKFLYDNKKPQKALEELNTALKYSPGHHQVYKNYQAIEKFKLLIEQELTQQN